jgi:probable HAF family extracellular repeat protein
MRFADWLIRTATAAILFFGGSSLKAQQYTFTSFDVPGGTFTYGFGVNTTGQISGTYYDGGWHGYLRSADGNTFTTFDYPGAVGFTIAHGLNDSEQVIGTYPYDAAGNGFLRSGDGSTFTNFDDPSAGPSGTTAIGINDAGQVVGGYTDASGNPHGFLRSIDGSSFTSIDFPGAGSGGTQALGINNSGQIVGIYFDSNGNQHGFITSAVPIYPTNKDQCKDDGWKQLAHPDGTPFKNQGDCIQFVNTGK